MRTVPLYGPKANGRVAFVDDADYELVMQYRWCVSETPPTEKRHAAGPYAQANIWRDGRRTTTKMHTLITGWKLVDHINHDGLDNQRSNLRAATRSQNLQNMIGRANRKYRFKGVDRAYRSLKWKAYIRVDGELRYLGLFLTEEEAARAYDIAAREAFGEYAYLNFPD